MFTIEETEVSSEICLVVELAWTGVVKMGVSLCVLYFIDTEVRRCGLSVTLVVRISVTVVNHLCCV
jgi:hypothetical protein